MPKVASITTLMRRTLCADNSAFVEIRVLRARESMIPCGKIRKAINLAPPGRLSRPAEKSETRERPRSRTCMHAYTRTFICTHTYTGAHTSMHPPRRPREIFRIVRMRAYRRVDAGEIECNIVQGTNYGREEKRRRVAIPTLNSARQRIPAGSGQTY